MTATPTAALKATAAFAGWTRRPGDPWTKVCEGLTEGDVWRQVLDINRELGGNVDSTVLPAGRRPGR